MLQVLAGIANPIEQDHFVNEVASLLATRPETIRGLLRRSTTATPFHTSTPSPPSADVHVDADDVYLLALLDAPAPDPRSRAGTGGRGIHPVREPRRVSRSGRAAPARAPTLRTPRSIANWSWSSVYHPRSSSESSKGRVWTIRKLCSFANRKRSARWPAIRASTRGRESCLISSRAIARDRPAARPRAGKCRHQVTTDTHNGLGERPGHSSGHAERNRHSHAYGRLAHGPTPAALAEIEVAEELEPPTVVPTRDDRRRL